MDKAELRFTQAMWYAWGRMDSGEYMGKGLSLDPFEFGEYAKEAAVSFYTKQTGSLPSIQEQWSRYVEEKTP